MFRGTNRPRWDDSDVVALYRGVLRREPTALETTQLVSELNKAGTVETALKDMLSSHEFGIMMLPDLVNEHISRTPTQPIFFLHVPKTAGTSFRLDLSDALGVPAFLLFIHSSWSGFGRDETMHFWPFWAGHAGISAFPSTHRGVTIFRETRSRILSAYRQQERELLAQRQAPDRFYEESSQIAFSRGVTAAKPFSEWLNFRRSAAGWYVPAPTDAAMRRWNGVADSKYVESLSKAELTAVLETSLARFDAAAWAHDQPAMHDVIRRVTGTEGPSSTRRENIFTTVETTKPTTLTSEDIEVLNRVATDEALLFNIAVDQGLIPPISQETADDEFEKTAKRLGFAFA